MSNLKCLRKECRRKHLDLYSAREQNASRKELCGEGNSVCRQYYSCTFENSALGLRENLLHTNPRSTLIDFTSLRIVLPNGFFHLRDSTQRNGYISKLMLRSTNKRMENVHYVEFLNCNHHRILLQLSTEGRWDGPDMGIKELCRKSW